MGGEFSDDEVAVSTAAGALVGGGRPMRAESNAGNLIEWQRDDDALRLVTIDEDRTVGPQSQKGRLPISSASSGTNVFSSFFLKLRQPLHQLLVVSAIALGPWRSVLAIFSARGPRSLISLYAGSACNRRCGFEDSSF